jgi:hypothetical protein
MRRALVGLLPFAFLAGAVGQEASSKEDVVVVYGVYPQDGRCTEFDAMVVAFEVLLRDVARYRNTCISTVAWIFRSRALSHV